MAIYKFRVTFEDQDDVSREIEVKGVHTFRELADCVLRSVGFDDKHSGSFFISDDFWRFGPEYVWKDTDRETGLNGKKKDAPLKMMEKAKVVNHIDDPHQKFIFVYDYKEQWTFHIELGKIVNEESGTVYPRCSRSLGVAPKQYKQVLPPPSEDEEDLMSKLRKEIAEADEEPSSEQIVAEEEGMDEEDIQRTSAMSEEGEEPGVESEEGGEAEEESAEEFGSDEEDH